MYTEKPEEIRDIAKQIDAAINNHKRQIRLLEVQKEQLQDNCKHPDKFRYSAMGEVGWKCPDCGWQT